jgi:hypothetical protein
MYVRVTCDSWYLSYTAYDMYHPRPWGGADGFFESVYGYNHELSDGILSVHIISFLKHHMSKQYTKVDITTIFT